MVYYHGINILVFYLTTWWNSLLISRKLRRHILMKIKRWNYYEWWPSFLMNMIQNCFFFIIMDARSILINFIYTYFSCLFYYNRWVSTTLDFWRNLITWDGGAPLKHWQINSDSTGFRTSFHRIKFSALSYLNLTPN